jgi:hypothetical protein
VAADASDQLHVTPSAKKGQNKTLENFLIIFFDILYPPRIRGLEKGDKKISRFFFWPFSAEGLMCCFLSLLQPTGVRLLPPAGYAVVRALLRFPLPLDLLRSLLLVVSPSFSSDISWYPSMDDGCLCSICCSLLKHAVAIMLLRSLP